MLKDLFIKIDRLRRGQTDRQIARKIQRLKTQTQSLQPSDDPIVIFAMPLVSKRRSADWDRVQSNLDATLASFMAQTNPNWMTVICGQDRPELPDDPRVVFLKAHVRDKFYDKGDKRRILINHIAAKVKRDGYYMQFDADDILHPEFTKHILSDHNGLGYLVDTGHFVALATQHVIPLENFGYYCGSCAAVYVDFRTNRHFKTLLNEHRSHMEIAEICEQFGRPLDIVPFSSVLYITGHGENMYGREGYLDERTRKLIQQAIPKQDADKVLESYGVTWDSLAG